MSVYQCIGYREITAEVFHVYVCKYKMRGKRWGAQTQACCGISSEEGGPLRSAVWGRQGVHGQGLRLWPASPRGPNAVIGLEERCDADS